MYADGIKLLEYAESRQITSQEDMKHATDDLSLIAKLKKAIEERRKEYVNPIRAHLDVINNAFKMLTSPIEQADQITRKKMLEYKNEQERKRKEQEEVNRLRMAAAQKEAALNGTGEISEDVNLVEVAPEQPKRVITDMGGFGTMIVWKYVVTDFAALPDDYKVADTAMLNAIAKKHHDQKQIPGVRFYCDETATLKTK